MQEGKIFIGNLKITPDLTQEIKTAQKEDNEFQTFWRQMLSKGNPDFKEGKMAHFTSRSVFVCQILDT
jgi:hypothetical protein